MRKWGSNIPFRVKFDGESIGSILRARRDLQQRRIARFVSKNVLKRKSATLKKYGGKLKNGGPFFLWNVWSDFLLDRWRRSGVIRMSAAAARAPTILKFRHSCLAPGSFHRCQVVEGARDATYGTVWSTSRILLRTSPAGCVVMTFDCSGLENLFRKVYTGCS